MPMSIKHVALMLSFSVGIAEGALSQAAEEPADTTEHVIEQLLLENFTDRWRAGDAEGLASLWHEDGDWMSLVGSRRIFQGREQIEQVWSIGLEGRDSAEARMLAIEIDSFKKLAPDLAQVDMVMTFGHESTGILREAMLAIVSESEAGWKILSSRVARISSVPARE